MPNAQMPVNSNTRGWSSLWTVLTFVAGIASMLIYWIFLIGYHEYFNEERVKVDIKALQNSLDTLIQQQKKFQNMLESQQDFVDQLAGTKEVSKQYKDIAQKLEMIERNHDKQGRDTKFQQHIDQLKGEVQGLMKKITSTSTDIKETMKVVQNHVLGVSQQYKDNTQKLEMIQRNLDTQGRDTEFHQHIDQLKKEVQGLMKKITSANSDIKETKETMKVVQNHVLGVSQQYKDNTQKLEMIQRNLDTQGRDTEFHQHIDQLKKEVQGLMKKITSANSDIKETKETMKVVQNHVLGVSQQYKDVAQKLETIQRNHDTQGRDTELHQHIDQLKGEVQILTNKITKKTSDIKEMKETMKDVQNHVLRGGTILFKDCFAETDIVILLDSSGSVQNEGFETMKRFIADLTLVIDLHPNNMQLGLVTFDITSKKQFALNDYHSARAIRNKLKQVNYVSGGATYIGRAIDKVRKFSFAEANGGRKTASKVLILLTDGSSRDSVKQPSVDIHKEGVTVVTIGIGEHCLKEQLEKIASDPALIFYVKSFDALEESKYDVLKELCNPKTTTKHP